MSEFWNNLFSSNTAPDSFAAPDFQSLPADYSNQSSGSDWNSFMSSLGSSMPSSFALPDFQSMDPSGFGAPSSTPSSVPNLPAPTTTPASGGFTGALKSMGSSIWDSVAKNPLSAIGLTAAGISALNGPSTPASIGPLRNDIGKVTQGLTTTGQQTTDYIKSRGKGVDDLTKQLMAHYQNGTLDPSDQARIDQWTQQAKAQMESYFAKAGISDSTAHNYQLGEIGKKAAAMSDEVRQGYLQKVQGMLQLQSSQTGQVASTAQSTATNVANLNASLAQTIATIEQSGDTEASRQLMAMMQAAGFYGGMK